MVNKHVRVVNDQLRRREGDRVKWDVVLGHKLVMDNLLAIYSPAFPFIRVV